MGLEVVLHVLGRRTALLTEGTRVRSSKHPEHGLHRVSGILRLVTRFLGRWEAGGLGLGSESGGQKLGIEVHGEAEGGRSGSGGSSDVGGGHLIEHLLTCHEFGGEVEDPSSSTRGGLGVGMGSHVDFEVSASGEGSSANVALEGLVSCKQAIISRNSTADPLQSCAILTCMSSHMDLQCRGTAKVLEADSALVLREGHWLPLSLGWLLRLLPHLLDGIQRVFICIAVFPWTFIVGNQNSRLFVGHLLDLRRRFLCRRIRSD